MAFRVPSFGGQITNLCRRGIPKHRIGSLRIVIINPIRYLVIRFIEQNDMMLPDTFFLKTPEESLDHAILFRCIWCYVLLIKMIFHNCFIKSLGTKHKAVIRPHDKIMDMESSLLPNQRIFKSSSRDTYHRYESLRMQGELKDRGYRVISKRVARLMKKEYLGCVHKTKYRITTNSNHTEPVAKNIILDRQFFIGAWESVGIWHNLLCNQGRMDISVRHHRPLEPSGCWVVSLE